MWAGSPWAARPWAAGPEAAPSGTAYIADITPTSYTTTFASITALAGRRAEITPVAYATTFADASILRTWRANVTPASYLMSPSTISAAYSGEAPVLAGLLPWIRRRRRR